MLNAITPLILTYNESPNIRRTLEQLTWVKKIVIIDSFSTDATLEILKVFPQVHVFQRKFDSFASQCNYGLSEIQTDCSSSKFQLKNMRVEQEAVTTAEIA